MKPPLIIITTYWKKGNITMGDPIYDHPSDILQLEKETLSATLRSLHNIEGDFEVLVLGVPTNNNFGIEIDSHILDLISVLPISYPIRYFGSSDLEQLKISLKNNKFEHYLDLVSNTGYGNVRNLSLILAHLLGFEVTILIDDDEIVIDRNFLGKAMEIIGRQYEGKRVDLVLGYYLNSDGNPLIEESDPLWWQLVWKKTEKMNDSFRIILDNEKPRYILNPSFALGGLMVIHKNCWLKVAFDPLISRGEDMDFLRNAHFLNHTTYLDRSLSIVHKPPPSLPSNPRDIFLQDVKRFIYSQYKLNKLKISPDNYDPYPGYFLKQIEGKVLLTDLLFSIFTDSEIFLRIKTREDLLKQISDIEFSFNDAHQFAKKNSSFYHNFQEKWEAFMKDLDLKFSLSHLH
ncbi:MAG: hypothetical protein ACXAC6_05105 [Candidatus Hodarchaeales archaeon]